MKKMNEKIFNKKIDEIIAKENPQAILLVGSLSRMDQLDFDDVRDIDIFVITDQREFEREVVVIEGLEFDISYISIEDLEKAIEKKLASIICILAKCKILYNSKENTLKNYLKVIKSIYDEGPNKLTKSQIDYERFKLTQTYLTLVSRKNDSLNFNVLKGIFVKELISSYFILNNMWISPDKRLLKSIKDKELTILLEDNLVCTGLNIDDEIESLKKLIDCVLKPFGGQLRFWEKNKFPFDFL